MTRTTKFIITIVGMIGLLAIAATYYKFFVIQDYTTQIEIDCDPESESCFIYECDPESEECTGDPNEDIWYYKLMHRKAYNIPLCDPYNSDDCEALSCEDGEADCYEELCTESSGEECTDPADFIGFSDKEEGDEEESLDEESESSEENEEDVSIGLESESEEAGDTEGDGDSLDAEDAQEN